MIKHIKKWNKWRKNTDSSIFYQICVLFGLSISPSFIQTLTDEEEALYESWLKRRGDKK